jgi:hypothetical protein
MLGVFAGVIPGFSFYLSYRISFSLGFEMESLFRRDIASPKV